MIRTFMQRKKDHDPLSSLGSHRVTQTLKLQYISMRSLIIFLLIVTRYSLYKVSCVVVYWDNVYKTVARAPTPKHETSQAARSHQLTFELFIYLLSYYLANKRSLHVRSQGLEILTLIGKKLKLPTTAITKKIA